MYSSIQIANYFLRKGQNTGIEITPMKLIKLVYIAHGWTLGFKDEPLLIEQVYAWKYGPVIEKLYDYFKVYGSSPISELYAPNFIQPPPLPGKEAEEILEAVWKAYGHFDGISLSAMTHKKGTPWYSIWHQKRANESAQIPIPNDLIKKYYKEKIEDIKMRRNQLQEV
ncbi:MAG TPA: type II toxin-antitoxin system antitoxin SocA domain-containing protein [Chitinophagaceae bacterium]|nr:type II toxin-antitoxin system antitoxin SocA domain-containing protein [Chitinophagaceae bacterium]